MGHRHSGRTPGRAAPALAATIPTVRRRNDAWHLAAAATAADDALADELEQLADEDRERFGHAAASAALERAAHLSVDPAQSARRLAAAIEGRGDGRRHHRGAATSPSTCSPRMPSQL